MATKYIICLPSNARGPDEQTPEFQAAHAADYEKKRLAWLEKTKREAEEKKAAEITGNSDAKVQKR